MLYAATCQVCAGPHSLAPARLTCQGSGRSLFAARDLDVSSPTSRDESSFPQAEQTLLQIPASALLNPLSLSRSQHSSIPQHLFPTSSSHPPHPRKKPKTQQGPVSSRKLNTTQLLTLQLALSRHGGASSSDPWQPYLATLPSSFSPWHPLTWLADPTLPKDYRKVVDELPVGAKRKLEEVRGRFEGDRELLRTAIVSVDQIWDSSAPAHESRLRKSLSLRQALLTPYRTMICFGLGSLVSTTW